MNFPRFLAVLCVSALLLTCSTAAFAAGGQGRGYGKAGQATDVNRGGKGIALNLSLGRADGAMSARVAEYLGISQEDLIAARQSGKSLVQIASGYGVAEQDLVDFIMKDRSALLDQLVNDGKLTWERADLQKSTMAGQVRANINRTTVGSVGKGQNNGFGGNKGNGRGTGVCPYLNTAPQ